MTIVKTEDFQKQLKKLPHKINKLTLEQIRRFRAYPRDARLHIKKLTDLDGAYSFRITRAYRALFYFDRNGDAILFAIGHRKEIYD